MKKIYTLAVLNLLVLSYRSLAQEITLPAQLLALHTVNYAANRVADIPITGKVTDEKGNGLPDYYFPKGAVPPPNAFTNLDLVYPLPAVEAALSPYF